MKKIIAIALIASIVSITSSCKKKDDMVACINGPLTIERGFDVLKDYSWCGSGEEEVSWTCSNGESANGVNFPVKFSNPGKYTITATATRGKGKKKESISKSIEVEYGTIARIKCYAYNSCYVGNQNISNASGYKAYLYSSITDWETDIVAKNRNKVKDSVNCVYSSDYSTIYGEFAGAFPAGSTYYVMVENETGLSGAMHFSAIKRGISNAGQYGHVLVGNAGPSTSTIYIDESSKKFFSGKWVLVSNEINSVNAPIPACNQDDYLKFFPDGTWKYETGPDNCGGTSLPSNGTYPYMNQFCNTTPPSVQLTTLSGPFTGITNSYFENGHTTFRVDYTVGANTGIMRFNYQP
ncbi:MAG: hypothetical protein KBG47_02005 [Bacteroidia bacterium]|nr:hypothetical protein [Sphingobacteriaceae bacterium]MBK7312018.1 hypothetical protein [Sphingobacteriaceae bacterium]MBP9068252.1 hypothetical protein [Bacteroidia bacterium]